MLLSRAAQIFFLSMGAAMQLCCASYAETSFADHFKYVADAVNQINFLWAKSADPQDNAKEIAEQSCKMLTQLVADQEFKNIIAKTFRPVMNADLKNTMLDLAKINDLIDKEEQALQAIGINHLTSIQALAAAIPFAKTIDVEKVNPEMILKDISDLKDRSCSVTVQIEHNEHLSSIKSAVAFGAAGVAIVLGDGVAAYASAGSASLFTAASLAVGGQMAAQAVHDLIKP
jgi:hypothetical protein